MTTMAFDAETTTLEPLCRAPETRIEPRVSDDARDVFVPLPADFRLASGQRLGQSVVAARLHGRVDGPLIVVAGGISSGRFVHRTETNGLGWWSGAVSDGGPIDLKTCRVLAFDFAPDAAPGAEPVTITTQDQARLLALVLDHIGAERVAAFVGCSYGGMVGLAFAEQFPKRLGRLIVVSAAHRAHPQATAWRGIQRRILQFAASVGRPEDGVALARELAMTTYRTPEEFAERFDDAIAPSAGDAYPVCGYLTSRGEAYRSHTTPARWLSLSDSIDRHRVTPEAITVPTFLIGFTSDRLVPIDDIRELAARLPNLWRLVEAPSLYGHDAFLKEDAFVGDILKDALKDIEQ